jgi:hypothetical protein
MRKLIVQTFVTLDGVVQAPGGPGEDDDGGFAHGGWSVSYWDDPDGPGHGRGPSRLDSTVSSTGVVMGTWEPAGELVPGSFARD